MNGFQLGLDEISSPANLRAYLAEMIGTMLFVVLGTGTAIAVSATAGGIVPDQGLSTAGLVAIAVAHGLGIAVVVYATHNISGGHVNPIVTVALMLTRHIKIGPGAIYILVQFGGAILGTALLYAIVNDEIGNITNFGAHAINTDVVGEGGAFLAEIITGVVLVSVIFSVAVSRRGAGVAAPLAIGLTVMLFHLIFIPMTGASAHPARTFAPALLSNAFDSYWVYVLGPTVGAIIAAVLYHHVFRAGAEDEPER